MPTAQSCLLAGLGPKSFDGEKAWPYINRYRYITVDYAMAASQNGFCSYKHFIHKKTNIMQIMTKNITIFILLIFYQREIVKIDHFMTLSLSYANTVLLRKIHRFAQHLLIIHVIVKKPAFFLGEIRVMQK
jgi:hypothetical protein